MSDFFVQKFNQRHKCPHCKTAKLKVGKHVYSLCESHLNKAREQWRSWQEQRRVDGKCCYCDKHSFNGWLRCKLHTEINREKCKRWMAANKERHAQQSKLRKQFWRSQGRCHICAPHNKLDGNFLVCSPCRVRHQTHKKSSAGQKYTQKLPL